MDCDVDVSCSAKSFIERYTKYVLQRAKTFTSKFEEMKVIGEVRRLVDSKQITFRLLIMSETRRPALRFPGPGSIVAFVCCLCEQRDITPKDLVGQLLKAEKVIASGESMDALLPVV